MKKGREKCEILKAIRAYVADKYGIEYTPTECNHKGECRGTCPKCDAELEELQEELEKKGVSDISKDTKLSEMVEKYLSKNESKDDDSFPTPDDNERTEGIPIPLQGDIMQGDIIPFEEEGLIPYPNSEDDVDLHCEDKKLFMECNVAGIAFHDIDDIWNELKVGTKLTLVRQKDNAYDKNAVAVALADDYDGDPENFDFDFILGYIPRKDNETLATMLDMGWEEMFETEISELREHVPYSDRIHISIYIKNKVNSTTEPLKNNRLRMMVIRDGERWKSISDEIWQKGYTYFRWGGFPPWEKDLPSKGDKVVFLYYDMAVIHLYLMQTIAVGEDAAPFVNDYNELFMVDDCSAYVLTNVVGPVTIGSEELQLPKDILQRYYQPDGQISQTLSDHLMKLFTCRQISDDAYTK